MNKSKIAARKTHATQVISLSAKEPHQFALRRFDFSAFLAFTYDARAYARFRHGLSVSAFLVSAA